MMNLVLAPVVEEFAGYFLVMLLERAGWHLAKRLRVPENLRLLPLPARRPELNPAEHVGEDRREKSLPNPSFHSLTALEDTLCAGLSQLAADPVRIRSLTDCPYMRVTF
jgi:hypothetical protein